MQLLRSPLAEPVTSRPSSAARRPSGGSEAERERLAAGAERHRAAGDGNCRAAIDAGGGPRRPGSGQRAVGAAMRAADKAGERWDEAEVMMRDHNNTTLGSAKPGDEEL